MVVFFGGHFSGDGYLDEVGDVHWHFLDLGVVELLNVTEVPDISLSEEVDGDSLPSETSGTSDTVDVVLPVGGEVEVNDEGDLLDVDTTGEQIGGDEDAGGTRAELAHDDVTLTLVHVSVLQGGEGRGGGGGKMVGLAMCSRTLSIDHPSPSVLARNRLHGLHIRPQRIVVYLSIRYRGFNLELFSPRL